MSKTLTESEILQRFAEIDARPAEEMTESEAKSLADAEAMDDGTTVSLEELKDSLSDYSGKILLRIPRSLHRELKEQAKAEGVSLNQYLIYRLSL